MGNARLQEREDPVPSYITYPRLVLKKSNRQAQDVMSYDTVPEEGPRQSPEPQHQP